MIHALTDESTDLVVGDRWVFDFQVTDYDDDPVGGVVPTVTVTLPDGSSSPVTAEARGMGVFRGVVPSVASEGRYVAHVSATGYGVIDFVAYVSATSAVGVTLEDLVGNRTETFGYLGKTSHSDEDVQGALDAEAAAQRRVCVVGAVYPPDLAEALKRRVQVNLNQRGQPAIVVADGGERSFTPTNDPVVRRLERPHRKLVMP